MSVKQLNNKKKSRLRGMWKDKNELLANLEKSAFILT